MWFFSSNLEHTHLSATVTLKFCSESMPSCLVFYVEVFGIFGFNNIPKDRYVVVNLAGALDQK